MTGTAAADRVLVGEVRAAYERGAAGWAAGPQPVYRRLAEALVGTAPWRLAGHQVLDLGAGTGAASEALAAAGAAPVATDLAVGMLAHRRSHRPPAVAADAFALPFRAASFDAVLAAFVLNHVPDPAAALRECRRVTRAGGAVLASTFPLEAEHPAKAAVEAVLEQFGYRRPDWYQAFKDRVAVRTGDPDSLARAAGVAGLVDVRVDVLTVEAGVDRPEVAVGWRLNMPHTLGFVAALDPADRAVLRARAEAALAGPLPSTLPLLALRARVP